jgi:PAS domain S-box-containing protein
MPVTRASSRPVQAVWSGGTVEVPAVAADGREFPIELSLGAIGCGADRILTAVIRDLTDRRRKERHLAAQLAVTSVLAAPHSAAESATRIVEALTRALGWELGGLWTADADQRLRLRHIWQADPETTGAFARMSAARTLEPGEGMAGRALSTGLPQWVEDVADIPSFVRKAAAAEAGLRGGIWLPLISDGHVGGVIECMSHHAEPVDSELRDLLMTVASQAGEHLRRLTTQERLDEARSRFTAAFVHAPIGVGLIDEDGRWIDGNPALCAITGYSPGELVGRSVAQITHPDDVDESEALRRRVSSGEVVRGQRELRYLRPSGEPVWVSMSVSMVDSASSPYLIAQVQDITELRAAADAREQHAVELERSNAELERFAAVAAHDLRTPLRTISGFTELLLDGHGAALTPEGREFLGMIRESADGSSRLLENLLSYARAGGGRLARERVDAGRIVEGVLTALRSQIESRGADVTVAALPSVSGNPVQLAQLFQNLVENAIKVHAGRTAPPHRHQRPPRRGHDPLRGARRRRRRRPRGGRVAVRDVLSRIERRGVRRRRHRPGGMRAHRRRP